MFYVGVHVSYDGANKARLAQVRLLDKLGTRRGRAERFLTNNPPLMKDGVLYRAMVLALPPSFILRNDVINMSLKSYRCDWQTAKFHAYRLAAVDVLGKSDVWSDVLAKAEEPVLTPEQAPEPTTETPQV